MIKCKNCGADTRFDIDNQLLVCDYCDSTFEVKNVQKTDITSEQQMMEGIIHTCPQCGAEIFTTEDTAATFCSYCGSSVLLESRLVMAKKPDFIIPFSISREEAEKAYKKMLRRAVFAPDALKKAEIESIRGIYMPYWEYYLNNHHTVKISTTMNGHQEGNYYVSDRYQVSFKAFIESDGLEFDASSKLPDDLSQAVAPFYFKESKLFNSGYMSGFYADLGDVNPDIYSGEVTDIVKTAAVNEIIENSNLKSYGVDKAKLRSSLSLSNIKPGMAMYPMWFASARDKKGKYINYALINGQSGKTAADLPVDKKKIIIGTVLFAIPLFFLMYFLFTPNRSATLVITAILSIIGTVIGRRKADELVRYDKGAGITQKKRGKKEKSKQDGEKKKMMWRMIAAIVISILVLIWAPVNDIFYYIASIISGVLCGWTFWRIFELHNQSTLRPLPQLGKRGGDK